MSSLLQKQLFPLHQLEPRIKFYYIVLLSDNTILRFQINNVDFEVAILVFLNYLLLIYLITIYDETQQWG